MVSRKNAGTPSWRVRVNWDFHLLVYGTYIIHVDDLYDWACDKDYALVGAKDVRFMDGNSDSVTTEGGHYVDDIDFVHKILTEKMLLEYINDGELVCHLSEIR